ncbi:MAG: tyrosine-type recombinase/integrase [Candidatus Dormibacter sp.]
MPQARNKLANRPSRTPAPRSGDDAWDWERAASTFLRDCRRRGHTPSTQSIYQAVLLGPRTQEYRRDQQVEKVSDLTADRLRQFEVELQEAELAPSTVHQYHRVLKTFLGFCAREGMGVDERVRDVAAPRLAEREPGAYTPQEETRLLAAARDPRDRMIVELLLTTGLRLSELIALDVEDIVDLGRQGAYLRVRQGKGRKDRNIPFDDGVYRQLQTYLRRHRPAGPGAIFTARRAAGALRPLSNEAIKSMLRRLGDETGIHCHAHKFRHTFASRAIADGIDPLTLQRVLGHTTLQMVSRYVHYSAADLMRAWRRAEGSQTPRR